MTVAYLSLATVRSGAQAHPYSLPEAAAGGPKLTDVIRAMETGAPFDRGDLPEHIVRTGTERTSQSILAAGLPILDRRAAEVFRAHDLGEGFLWDMPVVDRSGAPVADAAPWAGLYVGAVKDGLDVGASTGIKKAFGMVSLDGIRIESGAKHLAMRPEAAQGADVWREKALTGQLYIFLSPRLVAALEAAGIAADFDLVGCTAA